MANRYDLLSNVSAIGAGAAVQNKTSVAHYRACVFIVSGTLVTGPCQLEIQDIAGNWVLIPNSAISASPGAAEVTVPPGQIRANILAGSCSALYASLITP